MNAINENFKSLTAKLLAINVPMVSIALLALFSVLELQYYRTERAELVRSLHSLVDLQSSAFAGDAWEYDTDHIAVLLNELANLPQLQSAVVFDDSAVVLGRIGDADAKPEAPDLMVEQPLVYETDQYSATVGALVVTFHSGVIWKNVENHLKINALILVVLLATLMGVTLIAVRVVIGKPIGRLLNSIERMRSNRVFELVDWQSADELGRVVDAYNEMQTKQAEAEAALIEHQNHLEAEVAARTAELSAIEVQLRVALDNMPGGMFMIDEHLDFQVFNDQYAELLALPGDAIRVGGSLSEPVRIRAERGDYGPGDMDELVEQQLKGYTARETLRTEETLPGERVIEFHRRPTDEGGTVAVATDITDRKRAEEALRESEGRLREGAQSAEAARLRAETALAELKATQQNLIQAEKMASLGQLTAGIAHEIKNPLNFINNFAEISSTLLGELKEEIEPAVTTLEKDNQEEVEDLISTLSGNLGSIHEQGQRVDSIVKGMLLHSRGGAGEHALTDVNYLAEEALNLAYHGARAQDPQFNVTLERDLDPDVGSIDIVPQEISRVLLNLLGNGFYATQKRRRATQDDAYEPAVGLTTSDLGDSIEIRVRDNGIGMSPSVIEMLFTPFFTTKPPGEGTGLGLSISYDIVVRQHNGQLTVDSKEGQYTEFIITLPRQRSGEAAAPAERGSA